MTDLPPDVRAEAAAAVYELPSVDTDDSATFAHAVVDAVTSVVAPEIARQLKAEDERAETDRNRRLAERIASGAAVPPLDDVIQQIRLHSAAHMDVPGPRAVQIADELAKAQARIEELEAALSRMLSAGTMDKIRVAQDNARAVLAKGEKP